MSNSNDIKFAAVVLKILTKSGVDGSLVTRAAGVFDPALGTLVATEVTTSARLSPPLAHQGSEVDGTTILSSDSLVYVAGTIAITPKAGDEVLISGLRSTIKSVNSLYSGEDIAAYEMNCARGVNA
jgi:hypothetical protein